MTISFNQAAFLERAIRSVVAQRETVDLDYIVIDPGSTDGSRDILAAHAADIDQLILEPDAGPGDGLNKGLAAARGVLFAYLNSDDEYLPGALAAAQAAFDAEPALDVAYASGWMVDADGRRLRHLVPNRRFTAAGYARGLVTIVQQASVMRTATLRDAGGFNVANRSCWDGEAFFEMARAGARFRRLPGDWALFRLHAGSITGGGASERYAEDQRRIFRRCFGRDMAARDGAARHILNAADLIADPRRLAALTGRLTGRAEG